jgi:hypothetical protein
MTELPVRIYDKSLSIERDFYDSNGAQGGNRTHDLKLRRLLLFHWATRAYMWSRGENSEK